jgi:hypothetical protein
MIKIFCDFRKLSAKKWRFSQKQSYDHIFPKASENFGQKRQIFRQMFRRKYF